MPDAELGMEDALLTSGFGPCSHGASNCIKCVGDC